MKARIMLLLAAVGLLAALAGAGCPNLVPVPRNRVLFRTDRDGNEELYLVDSDGTDTENLTQDPADNYYGVVTPDASQIVFASAASSSHSILVRMNLDGSGRTTLVDNEAYNHSPVLTPDGLRVIFQTNVFGTDQIGSIRLDTGTLQYLTSEPKGMREPVVRPDGSQVAFRATPNGDWDICAVSIDGTGWVNLTNYAAATEGSFVYSPDGSRIAFETNRDGNEEIYIMNADGSSPVNLSQDSIMDFDPVFSPDGQKVLYQSTDYHKIMLNVVNRDGTGQLQLSDQLALQSTQAWSPDSYQIAFVSAVGDIFVIDVNGTGLRNLTNGTGPNDSPVWTLDGKKVLFRSFRDGAGNSELYWENAVGGPAKRLTNSTGHDVFLQFLEIW